MQVRNVLETPAPRVLAWSSKAQQDPVGTKVITWEKVEDTAREILAEYEHPR